MPGIRTNAAPHEAYPADLATELPTSTLADTKHTRGDDSPTVIFPTARTTSYSYTPPTARFVTPASPEAAVNESGQPDQGIINQAHIKSLLDRAGESSRLGTFERALGAVALAGIRRSTGYGARWEPDESSSIFSHITVVTPNEAGIVDPTDVANLESQRYQDSFDQARKGATGVAIGGAMVAAGFCADRKSRRYLERAQKAQKEA